MTAPPRKTALTLLSDAENDNYRINAWLTIFIRLILAKKIYDEIGHNLYSHL